MANDAITMTGTFDKFGASAQKACWILAKSKIAESAQRAGDEPVNRAILFFGGANPEENHSRYYDNLRDMIQGLKEKGVKSENIIVMHADGLDPAPDQSVNPGYIVNSEMDFLRNEGIAVIPATQDGLENVFGTLRPFLKDNDHTLFYAFDHGGQDISGETLVGWHNEHIKDTDFAKIVDGLPGYKAYYFSECYSGGMIEDISIADGKTFVASATAPDEVSFGGEDGYAGGFAKALSLFGKTHELHEAASAMDKYADTSGHIEQVLVHGQEVCVEHPQMRGANFPVFYIPEIDDEPDDIEAIAEYGKQNDFVTDDEYVVDDELDNIEAIAEYGKQNDFVTDDEYVADDESDYDDEDFIDSDFE